MFSSKSIFQNTIGGILKKARQSHKWTLENAEKKLVLIKNIWNI